MAKSKAQPERPRAEWIPNYHQRRYRAEQAAAQEAAPAAPKKGRTPKAEASAEAAQDTTTGQES
jgi:hypothetical protein